MNTYTWVFRPVDGVQVAVDATGETLAEARKNLRSVFETGARLSSRPQDSFGNSAHLSVTVNGAELAEQEPTHVREHDSN